MGILVPKGLDGACKLRVCQWEGKSLFCPFVGAVSAPYLTQN